MLKLPIDQIQPDPNNTRKSFSYSDLLSLRNSVAQLGLLQPVTVEWSPRPISAAGW